MIDDPGVSILLEYTLNLPASVVCAAGKDDRFIFRLFEKLL